MISSPHNPKIQLVKNLLNQRRERYAQKAFVIEGVRLIEEALAVGLQPEMLLFSTQLSERGREVIQSAQQKGTQVDEIEPQLMKGISDTETSQGLLAIFPLQPLPIPLDYTFVIILDSIRDPGNLGAILRTASAAEVDLVLLAPGTTDPYAPKVLRAGMGAHFHLPIYQVEWVQIEELTHKAKHLKMYTADVVKGESCWATDLSIPLALVIGSEATGASQDSYRLSDGLIHIPMQGKMESLNASIAASIILYEVVRQRKS